ncbi:MAG: rhomboid family intramembrane serine protease [Candidatus Micrarchaeota archaeon]|nr:rhomboid family intramembrane serine protease [Candidatus Micrarchaeota archaeon]
MYYSLYIIAATVAAFIIESVATKPIIALFAFTPAAAIYMPWTFITSVFLHGGYAHLFFNMFALLMFGPLLEQKMGSKRFLWLYLGAGVIGSICYLIYAYTLGDPTVAALGASGAIFGVLGALAVLEPNLTVYSYPIFLPLPLWMAAIGWILLELVLLPAQDFIARAAHLGGIFLGIAYAYQLKKKAKTMLDF